MSVIVDPEYYPSARRIPATDVLDLTDLRWLILCNRLITVISDAIDQRTSLDRAVSRQYPIRTVDKASLFRTTGLSLYLTFEKSLSGKTKQTRV